MKETDWSDKIAVDMYENTWTCQQCNVEGTFNSIEKLQHQSTCMQSTVKETTDKVENIKSKPNSQAYNCPECSKTFHLTPIEILKHKRQHIKTNVS